MSVFIPLPLPAALGGTGVTGGAVFPASVAANALLYGSSSNVIAALSSANNGVLVTNGSGVPSISSTLPSGLSVSTPSNSTDIASKGYVDSVAQGLSTKASVHAATTTTLPAYTYANGALGVGATITQNTPAAGLPTQDGISLSLLDRFLVKNETAGNAPYNGIYTVTALGDAVLPFILTRSLDCDTAGDLEGAFVFVEDGTVNGGSGFVITADVATVGTDPVTWTQFSGAGEITAGTGLSKSGNTLSLINPVTLATGGTAANLTASNGGIVYSGASALAILSGTATAGQHLQSGSSTTPSWTTATFPGTATGTGTILRADGTNWVATTATYPTTTTANRLLYSSATSVIGEITSANSSTLQTDGSGIPGWVTNTNTAANNILPSQTSNSGKFLTTNGTNTSWGTAGSGTDYSVAIYDTTGQAVSTTEAAITFNTEEYDTNSFHSTSSNTSQIVFAHAGKYNIWLNMRSPNVGDYGYVLLNGTTTIGQMVNGGGKMTVSFDYNFSANDYIEFIFSATGSTNLYTVAGQRPRAGAHVLVGQ